MANFLGFVGKQVLPKAAVKHAHKHGWLDLRLGYALLRDKRVSIGVKLASLGIGLALTVGLFLLEVPLEAVIGTVLPLLGLALDFTFDGIEFVVVPVVVASLVIRWLAPKPVVDSLRI